MQMTATELHTSYNCNADLQVSGLTAATWDQIVQLLLKITADGRRHIAWQCSKSLHELCWQL